jgi:hypothetical protein
MENETFNFSFGFSEFAKLLAFSVAFPHQVFHLYGKLDDG